MGALGGGGGCDELCMFKVYGVSHLMWVNKEENLSKEKEETKCWRFLPTQLTKEKAKEKGRLVALDLTTSSSEVAYFENAWCSMAADVHTQYILVTCGSFFKKFIKEIPDL